MSSRSSTIRRSFGVESLESREVLSAGGPSAEAQAMLEVINMARTNPKAAAQWIGSHVDADVLATLDYYNVNLKSVQNDIANSPVRPPVAWSDTLAGTATRQSQDQADTGIQTHAGADGSSLDQRLDRAGYKNRVSDGENAYAYSKSVDHAMEAFLIDWNVSSLGHRKNILQPDATPDQFYREVGIGIVKTNKANFGPKVITQDFGRQAGSKAELLGVAYNDKNGNDAYDMGEGQGDVTVSATNVSTGKTTSTQTWDSGGGYQMSLDPGTYKVVAKVGSRTVRTDQVSINDQNVKVDYNLSQPWQDSSDDSDSVAAAGATAADSASASSAPATASLFAASTPTTSTPAPTTQQASTSQETPVVATVSAAIKADSGKGSFSNSWVSWTAGKK